MYYVQFVGLNEGEKFLRRSIKEKSGLDLNYDFQRLTIIQKFMQGNKYYINFVKEAILFLNFEKISDPKN